MKLISSLRFLRRAYDYFKRHWLISVFIGTLPAYWFTFIQVAGQTVGLMRPDGSLVPGAQIAFVSMFGVSLIFVVLKAIGDRQDEEAKSNSQYLYSQIVSSVRAILQKKYDRYSNLVVDHVERAFRKEFATVVEPKTQVQYILEELRDILADLSGIEKERIAISVLYRPDGKGAWQWLHSLNMSDDLSLGELTENAGTTFRRLMDQGNKVKEIFFASKQLAIEKNAYVPCQKDSAFGTIGTIICRDISVGHRPGPMQAVISVNTFGNVICEEDDTATKQRVSNIILPVFEELMKHEMCMIYLKEVAAPRKH